MLKHLFRIVKPLTFRGQTYLPGQETLLRSRGYGPGNFRADLFHDRIEPALHGVAWYRGPHYHRMWDNGYFTEQEVWENVIIDGEEVWQIGPKRRDEIVEYFENR